MGIFSKNALEKIKSREKVPHKHTILIVDDEEENLIVLNDLLSSQYKTLAARDGQEALALIQNNPDPEQIHLIISDQRMPHMDGVSFLEQSISIIPRTVRIILTGYSDIQVIIESINKAQIYQFILKPFDRRDLQLTVKSALESYELMEKNVKLMDELRILNASLEQKVESRTSDLREANQRIRLKNHIFQTLLETGTLMHKTIMLDDLLKMTLDQMSELFPDLGMGLILDHKQPGIPPIAFFKQLPEKRCRDLVKDSSFSLNTTTEIELDDEAEWRFLPMLGRDEKVIGKMILRGKDLHNNSIDIVTIFLDLLSAVAENKLLTKELERLANTDSLTGIYNRLFFDQKLETYIHRAKSSGAPPFAILYLDINGLKKVNDLYGHRIGDQLIVEATRLLVDACGPEKIVTRLGGDELAVLCPNTNTDQAEKLVAKIRKKQASAHIAFTDAAGKKQKEPIHMSIGMAALDQYPATDLLKLADQRMYEDKKAYYATRKPYRS